MALTINSQELDELGERIYAALDGMGADLLPFSLRSDDATPTKLEKYPRLLIGHIRRYGNTEAGFDEWADKVLRDALRNQFNRGRTHREYPQLVTLRAWLVEHRSVLENKVSAQQFERSLMARAWRYIYPRRRLVTAYAEAKRGDKEALAEENIRSQFRDTVRPVVEELSSIYGAEQTEKFLTDAEAFALANPGRLTWKAETAPSVSNTTTDK